MRERTPSADDTPKRAPPAPPGEADVAVRKARDAAAGCGASKMVASTHRLDELGARHVASQQQPPQAGPQHPPHPHHQHHHPPAAGPAQHGKSAQDKRSRLSSVINNLRHKKVAEEGQRHDRRGPREPCSLPAAAHGSSGRNLATLETYVMTVLSGVIDAEEAKPSAKEQERPTSPRAEHEPATKQDDAFSAPEAEPSAANGSQLDGPADDEAEAAAAAPRSLGAIILERLNEAQRPDPDAEVREVCRELIDDLLGELLAGLDDGAAPRPEAQEAAATASSDAGSTQSLHCSLPLDKVASVLPAAAVAEAAAPEPKPPAKPPSPTVRHLCLYCDRKFLSISLRQRHTERVHQASGGRRSERNTRKPAQQSCQYCVDQCPGNLEGLFRHMVGSHSDKYHGCLQCSTRYLTRDALATHNHEIHSQDKLPAVKETSAKQQPVLEVLSVKEEVKPSPAASPEFDTSFYSSVSCNIRENLLHHIDGKLQVAEGAATAAPVPAAAASPDAGGRTPQYQLPIDISLTAVTPVYSKDYPTGPEDYKNSSEYAGKPGKSCSRAHPRRVSFEKYNFPRKYDGKEQWNCTLKDLSKFDISTQLTLRKKQRLAKELLAQPLTQTAEVDAEAALLEVKQEDAETPTEAAATVFSSEFESFMRLKKRSAARTNADGKEEDDAGNVCSPAELTGEWSRPRVYICGACAERYITLKELEEHKSAVHPNVWCMHFEFSGDQRELYKHLVFLPGRCASPAPSVKTRQQTGASQQTSERVCTKCSKSCASLAELHRHMLECGGDQAWLLGLFGNGKKKCKWRPFGSRSRRRRQRGMKRNIQNSQTPRNAQPRERPQYTGPRVRPSDRESIQKMLANLPAKRATRKVLQENAARSQGRLRNAQSRAGAAANPASRMVKNKAVLRNKLLKNAKSFQRKKNLREDTKSQAAASSSTDSAPAPAPAGVGRPRKLLGRGAWHLAAGKKREDTPKAERKLRDAAPLEVVKRPVGRPKSSDTDPEQADKRRRRLEAANGSLSASLKARLQLRTNDGKFARIEKKKNLPPLDGKSVKIGRRPLNDPARLLTRSKLRAAAKLAWKEHTRISRRVTRLRSLDEKQQQDQAEEEEDEEEEEEEAPRDEASPALRGRPPRGVSRNSSMSSKSLEDAEKAIEEKPVERASPAVRGRRPKKVDESKATSSEEQAAKAQPEAELKTRSQKAQTATPAKLEIKSRRSLTAKETSAESSKKNSRAEIDASPSPANKDDKEKIGLTTRSNSRVKKDARDKSETVEGKKSTGSKDNGDKKLSKRGPKVAAENAEQQTEAITKKEKSGVLRKSLRNKEGESKEVSVDAATLVAEKSEESSEKDSAKDVTVTVTVESSGSIETGEKEEDKDSKIESVSETVQKKTVPGKRGRGRTKRVIETIDALKPSEMPIGEASKPIEPQTVESTKLNDAPPIELPKLIDAPNAEPPKPCEAPEIEPSEPTEAPAIEPSKPSEAPMTEPSEPSGSSATEPSNTIEAAPDATESQEIEEPTSAKESIVAEVEKAEEVSIEASVHDDTSNKSGRTSLPNLNLEHLQLESSNSNMDSGKENSAESLVNASKLKVVRPKKARGARKDGKTSGKRSLNSVIGILTEGVNVPAENAQEASIVLTVQTNPESQNDQENPRANDEQLSVENSADVTVEANDKLTVETSDTIVTVEPPAVESTQASEVELVESTQASEVELVESTQASEVELVESKSKEESLPKVQDTVEILKEAEKAAPAPIPEVKEEEVKPIAVHQPANDIILDLARRKPKGKGSFLEKIVSKIAKKKDVSLDGESTYPFDIVQNSTECQKKPEVVESIKTQECNSTKKAEEIKIESLLDKEASVKLNESTMVNIVNSAESTTILNKEVHENLVDTLSNNDKISDTKVTEEVLVAAAVHVETVKSVNVAENKEILNGAIETVEVDKALNVTVEEIVKKIDEKIIQEENKKVSEEEKVDVSQKNEEMEALENKEEKLEAENKQKQKSKKRSLESSSPKKNKKKSVDNEEIDEEEEDREELCLADIMKLIDRPKSKEAQSEVGVEVKQETVKPGKRKTPDDDTEPDSANVSVDDSLDQKKESSRKSKRKGAQKKNKREVAKVENENDKTKDIESSDIINVSLEKPIKDNVELKVVNKSEEVATQKESAITIGPMTGPVDEAKTLDSEQFAAPIVVSPNVNENSAEKLTEEMIEEVKDDSSSFTAKDSEKEEKISKRKKRSSKKNAEILETPQLTDKSPTNIDDESFKVPEMTEVAKPSKKRVSRRKHNRSVTSDQELEKDDDDIPDEKSDLGSDFAVDQNSSMSESEDRATPKRTSRRSTRNSRLVVDLEDVLIKESDDSDVSSANEMETSRRRRSQRKHTVVDTSCDLSENSIDESVAIAESKTEVKTEKKRGRKPKKIAPIISETLESTNDSEIPVDTEDKDMKKVDVETPAIEKLEESVNEVEEQSKSIEQKLENEQEKITHVENEEEGSPDEEKMVILDKLVHEEEGEAESEKSEEKPASTSEAQSSSLEETPDESDDKHLQEVSSSELDESGSLEPHAPKKRPAGNFAIVSKSGKILIVEKKKKLTKEAAKFFCDVCATSFTRKSSLKKHNLSQSHILQTTMSGDKDAKMIQEAKDAEKLENDGEKDSVETEEEDDSQHPSPDLAVSCEIGEEEKLLTADDSRSRIIDSVSPHSLIIPEPLFAHRSPQEQLEDEMLDEEICKITENMSHDEYVLTDHVSPVTPEATSTPAKQAVAAPVVEIHPEPEVKIAPKKKRKEKRKKNLADEHLDLNTPVPVAVSTTEPSLLDDCTIENTANDETIASEEKEVEKIDESSNKIDNVQDMDKNEEKSTKPVVQKISTSDTRRVSRNRNQNVLQETATPILENSRPKRNQLRPSYKEDENFDFDMDFPEEVSADDKLEVSNSKHDKMNASAIEVEQSDSEMQASGKRSKQTSRSRRDMSNVSVTETENSDAEKDVSISKQRGRKKKLEKSDTDQTLEFDSVIQKPTEAKEVIATEQIRASDVKVDSNEKSVDQSVEDKITVEPTIVPPKKKRGRKPKQQVQAEQESSVTVENSTENADSTIEESKSKIEFEATTSDESASHNQKQQKSKKNQKRRKKKESMREYIDDEPETDVAEPRNSKEEQENDEMKLKPSTLLESPIESTTNTDLTEVSIPARADPKDEVHCTLATKAAEASKVHEESKTDMTASLLGGFDSDDNSLGTDMSVDIQKLLDDPEMTTEIAKQPDEDSQIAELPNGIAPVDVINVKEPEFPTNAIAKDEEETQEIATEIVTKKSPKTIRSTEKKGKRRGRKAKSTSGRASSPSDASGLDDEEDRRKNDKVLKSKNKIVKSVFGRVFGEKVDKVREVLDDWQSRSENDSSDSETSVRSTSARRSRSRPKKKNLRGRKSREASSRSRQSKRRAEELISRAFNDSPLPDIERQRQSRRHHRAASPPHDVVDQLEDQKPARRKKSVARTTPTPEPEVKLNDEEEEDEEPLPEKFEESQSSLDRPLGSEPENADTANEAPAAAAYSSDELRSSSSSGAEHKQQPRRKKRKNRRSRKSATRLLASSQDEEVDGPTEVVTIGPTDALEDNALDLEMPAAEKPRPATKVLNFDEELFVECCSRLKATSEKELRGAKKIKLDHSVEQTATGSFHHHHRREEPAPGYRAKDRWRDVESQNSLGSLLESVNQLLGEEYNSHEKEYASTTARRSHHHHRHHHHHSHHHHHHHGQHHHHQHSSRHGNISRSPSPESVLEAARTTVEDDGQLGYDDSLDVAFEHNNKLRDKIQQRMRESESLIATSFGHKHASPAPGAEAGSLGYHGYDYEAGMHAKPKLNNGLGGLLDKALSNLLHHNEKHDHNGSTPMNLLAELACARAPTSTTPTVPEKIAKASPPHRELVASKDDYEQPHEHHHHHHHHYHESKNSSPKKSKNSIKELFERKKELHEKKMVEKVKTGPTKSTERSKKQKKAKSGQHNIPLIRTGQYRGGMVERKKRRDSGFKKEQARQDKNVIKDVYDFDEEESVSEPLFSSVLSYRAKTENSDKGLNMSALLSKTIGDTLTNGKSISAMGQNLESMVDRKFKDIEKLAPKSQPKTPMADDKSNHQSVIGPMDEFVERRQKSKRSSGEHSSGKHSGKSKKKNGKGAKKKSRNAWYEDDSSDEFVTKLKADDIGVGISKSQRTCSKGKQNLFAEMSSTSSESEFERDVDNDDNRFEPGKLVIATEPPITEVTENLVEQPKDKESLINDESQNAESQENWPPRSNDLIESRSNSPHLDLDNAKKSESEELSDHPLVIDENEKDPTDEQRTNSDDETERRTFELDDLYREDSSIVDSDRDELSVAVEDKSNSLSKLPESSPMPAQEKKASSDKNNEIEKYISLEDALEILDPPESEIARSMMQRKAKSSANVESAIPETDSQKSSGLVVENSRDEEEVTLPDLPEKLSGNEKPKRESENLPLHVFLSRKVQESKKRKQQQELKKLMEEQERIMLDLQPTRRQRKCAIGKQGLLAEISSSDDEVSTSHNRRSGDKLDKGEKSRSKQRQRESKEKRKERYIEKKHEQMIAKEQKAIEEAIMRELEEKRLSAASEASGSEKDEHKLTPAELLDEDENKTLSPRHGKITPAKHTHKQKSHESFDELDSSLKRPKSATRTATDTENDELNASVEMPTPKKKRAPTKSLQKAKKKPDAKTPSESKKPRQTPGSAAQQRRSKSRPTSVSRGKDAKESQPRSSSGRRESDLDGDEELKAAKSWNRLDEGVGVAIGRRKRAAANQLYYWSSSSDDEVELAVPAAAVAAATTTADSQDGQEDDRQEQHGWIVGDSHKKMITMLALEKQMKDKRRRSENDEQSPDGANGPSGNGGKGKSKKHRNSTS